MIVCIGHQGGSVVKHLPSAQVMIPEPWHQDPHQALCSAGSLLLPLPLPAALPTSALAVSLSNREI